MGWNFNFFFYLNFRIRHIKKRYLDCTGIGSFLFALLAKHLGLEKTAEAVLWDEFAADCVECGYCVLGCTYDRKGDALTTTVPAASQAGAIVVPDCEIVQIATRRGRAVGVGGGRHEPIMTCRMPPRTRSGRLVPARSDVVIQNYRPGVMDRLGLGYDAIAEIDPKAIYLSISGFGHLGDSPYGHWPAYAPVVEAMARKGPWVGLGPHGCRTVAPSP